MPNNSAVIADLRKRISAVEAGDHSSDFWSDLFDRGVADKASSQTMLGEEAPFAQRDRGSRGRRTPSSNLNSILPEVSAKAHAGASSDGEKCYERVDANAAMGDDECFAKICRLLNVRDRCSKELLERLVREGFDEDVAHDAIERAERSGLVDDSRFAETLVRSRLSQGKGINGIGRELRDFGIDACAVESYVSLADGNMHDREVSRAVELLQRKPPRSKNPRASAYRRLMVKGFGSNVAADASRVWWEEHCSRLRELDVE